MKISKQDQSLIAIGAGFLIIALLSKNYYFFIGTGIAVISSPFPALKNTIHTIWLKISEVLGWISQRIILSFLFFFILTPLALIKKIFSKDNLKIKRTTRTTTFITRNKSVKPEDMKNTW